ncbi:MAG TPA: NAD(P)H-hydrate dehydratase, partial [candidate division Zixibacteria bacterium]|nr:NAD(P)H-hydrate dehydratase [candidate division Zixibacteria bacterium]
EPADDTVWADFTYSIAAPKRGHYLRAGKDLAGVTQVVDIGIPEAVFDHFAIHENLITPEIVAELLPLRPAEGHKGTFGRLFLLVGSPGLTGAGSLAAQAAMRSGVGTATIGCPATLESIYETSLTEVMSRGLPCVGHKGALATRALGPALAALNSMNAGVIGPGLGLHRETMELVRRLVARATVPFTLDADALTACAKDVTSLEGPHHDCALTPHAGEFQRLTGETVAEDFEERLGQVRAAAKRFGAVVVLKGATTLICDPEGEIFVNPLGNSGMATAGSGDVLSGMIGSFLAQGLSIRDAAIVGVYLHSLAGDIAAVEIGERSLIAGDLIEYLPRAFELIEE